MGLSGAERQARWRARHLPKNRAAFQQAVEERVQTEVEKRLAAMAASAPPPPAEKLSKSAAEKLAAAIRRELVGKLSAAIRRELEAKFDARVEREVERRLAAMAAKAAGFASPGDVGTKLSKTAAPPGDAATIRQHKPQRRALTGF